MPRFQPLAILAAITLGAALPAAASAAFFPADTIDGPNGDVVRVGGVDVARDGTATVVYVKRVAGLEHVFAAQMEDGVWAAPERLDPGLALPSTDPVVAVANGGAAVVAFLNAGQLYTVVRRAAAPGWPGPTALGDGSAATPSIDLSVNGVGYVVWNRGPDVRAAWLPRSAGAFTPFDAPLDVTDGAEAGTGTGRPRVAASADGTALAAWGEAGRVYARRLLREDGLSQYPQDLTAASFNGHAGGVADLPDVDIADDSSFAWVTFRQAFDNNATTRVLARRLVGTSFDQPADVGGGAFGAEGATDPTVDVAGIGDAVFASDTVLSHTPFAALNYADALRAPFGLSVANAGPSSPTVAIGETSQAAVAWFDTDTGTPGVSARSFKFAATADQETPLADPALGPVDTTSGLHAAADRYGDAVIAFVQGAGATRRLMASVWDRPPSNLIQRTTFRWRTAAPLTWAKISEPWGPIVWTVLVDGRVIGTTSGTRMSIAGRVRDGFHRWTLVATDRRGQQRSAANRSLRIDTHAPAVRISVRGRRRAGSTLRFAVGTGDRHAGIRSVSIDFGDGSAPVFRSVATHRFGSGPHTVTVTVRDRAGNRTVATRRVAIG